MRPLIAALFGAGCGTGLYVGYTALRGRHLPLPHLPATATLRSGGNLALLAAGVLAGLVVWAATGWPVGGAAVTLAVVFGPGLVGGAGDRAASIERIEAIASWTEMLRDTIGKANGIEEAITVTAPVAPKAIAAEVARLQASLGKVPLPQALATFAEEVNHPCTDVVVAALIIAVEGKAAKLGPLLSRLAADTRKEARMRVRVEVDRAKVRTSATIVLAAVAAMVAVIAVFSRDYLDAYNDTTGQVALAAVVGLFAAGGWLLQRMSRLTEPERFAAPELEAGR